uniref:Uncharacterized protein n=1 Tax=Rousettus aegyptiacus TaxID=9407 RepID=A0A7J8FJM9_ROUAE|nr:hypothetical protein HJG63_012043 [Rousettus aegyptiacus]
MRWIPERGRNVQRGPGRSRERTPGQPSAARTRRSEQSATDPSTWEPQGKPRGCVRSRENRALRCPVGWDPRKPGAPTPGGAESDSSAAGSSHCDGSRAEAPPAGAKRVGLTRRGAAREYSLDDSVVINVFSA